MLVEDEGRVEGVRGQQGDELGLVHVALVHQLLLGYHRLLLGNFLLLLLPVFAFLPHQLYYYSQRFK